METVMFRITINNLRARAAEGSGVRDVERDMESHEVAPPKVATSEVFSVANCQQRQGF